MEQNRVVISEFGTIAYPDPCLNIFQRFMSRFYSTSVSDNCNINVCQIGDEFFALTEAPHIRKIDPDTLETLDKVIYLYCTYRSFELFSPDGWQYWEFRVLLYRYAQVQLYYVNIFVTFL